MQPPAAWQQRKVPSTKTLPVCSAPSCGMSKDSSELSEAAATSPSSLGSRHPRSAKRTCALSENRWRCFFIVRAPKLEPAFQRRGGERAGGPRAQPSASPSPRSPPGTQPIAASAPSIAAHDELASCSGRHPAPSCSLSAGRATRTPAAVTHQHAPSAKRRAPSYPCARALHGRARGGRSHGLGLRQARRRVGRYERPLPAGSLRGAAGFLAKPARLPRPGRALAEGRLNAGSGWFPCGTSTASKVINGISAQRVTEPVGTSSELRAPERPRAKSEESVPSRTSGQADPAEDLGLLGSRRTNQLLAERSWRRPSSRPGGTGVIGRITCEESERHTTKHRPR